MAEILGIASSIIAVLQLAGKAAELSYGYIGGVKRAPEDIQRFLDELNSLTKVLATLRNCLHANPGPTTPQLSTSLQECLSEMSELKAKLEPKDWWRKKVARYKWPLRRSETSEYTSRIERYKSLFVIALSADQLSRSNTIETEIREMRAGQSEGKRKKVLNWLSSQPFDKKHNEISGRRQENTGDWLLKRPEIQDWIKKNHNSPLLWGYGIPGAGKTFLSSRIIDYLVEQAPKSLCAVAYIYFDYKEQEKQKPDHVLASLVKQLACQLKDLPRELEELHDNLDHKEKRPSYSELYTILLLISRSFTQTFIICDALDECDQKTQRRELLPLFHQMAEDGINLFLTSREYPEDIQDSFQSSEKVKLGAEAEDIARYIERKIQENPRARRLFGQEDLRNRAISELTEYGKGMFLLVRFHIGYLCQQTTVRGVITELERLKDSISEECPLDPTYDRAMRVLREQNKSCVALALRILSWLVKARRTITVRELQVAVSVKEGQTTLDQLDLPDRNTLLDVCASLVTIDEKSDTVKLVHYTVQEYILKNSIIPDADFETAMTCTTFLSFDVFAQGACTSDSSVHARLELYPFLDYAAQHLSSHLKACSEALSAPLILRFLANQGLISSYLQAFTVGISFGAWEGQYDTYPKGVNALHVAAALGHFSVVQLLLDNGTNASAATETGWTALHEAALSENESIARLLLENNADISATTESGWTSLHEAASSGNEPMTRLLLEYSADISAATSSGWTALHEAALNGHESIVQLLVYNDADIFATTSSGLTALGEAVSSGHEPVARFLLEYGADISTATGSGWTALHEAVLRGHEPMVRLLLENGADIFATTETGWTTLHEAASSGHELIVQLLLENGADTSTATETGWTVLHEVVLRGHKPIVQLLLENCADVFATTESGWTALHEAASSGNEEITRLLLDYGADIMAITETGLTTLHEASSGGNEQIVRLLLENGADIFAVTEAGWTALHEAVMSGHEPIARLLLENGADIFATTETGWTVLKEAALSGHESIARLLLENGPKISAAIEAAWASLYEAASSRHGPIARGISSATKSGLTTLYTAKLSGVELVAQLLLEKDTGIEEHEQMVLYEVNDTMNAAGGTPKSYF